MMPEDSSSTSKELLGSLESELADLATRVGTSTDRVVGVGNRLIASLEKQSAIQSRYQKTVIALTVVIALATIFYTIITWLSVQAMREANEIQRQQLQRTNVSK